MTIIRHDVTLDGNGDASCSCRQFSAKASLYGGAQARQLAHAHVANPDATVPELFAFVSRPVPEANDGLAVRRFVEAAVEVGIGTRSREIFGGVPAVEFSFVFPEVA
ncbi:MAG TPA: hypothetical protein VHB02_06300 [Acidimicrobiales bacterium]|nr:hypothetical protein [Acidimicrobiales bacterium]